MSDGPRIIATDGKFRLIRIEDGDRVAHVLEKRDGADALGVERWKEANIGSADTLTKQLRDWVIEHALRCERMKVEE